MCSFTFVQTQFFENNIRNAIFGKWTRTYSTFMLFIFSYFLNLSALSLLSFVMVVLSFILEAKSRSPYKSLFLSNFGLLLYNLSAIRFAEINFPIYFILVSFINCSWYFILKNIEEEEDEDRGFLRNLHNESLISVNDMKNELLAGLHNDSNSEQSSGIYSLILKIIGDKRLFYLKDFFTKDVVHYAHPQRKIVHGITYIILSAILISFFYV